MARSKTIRVPTGRSRILALKSVRDESVVAHGAAIGTVLAKAKKAGAREPIVVFVPKRGRRYIY